jgi:hypothetical protein
MLRSVTAKSELVVLRVIRIRQLTIGYYVAESLVGYFKVMAACETTSSLVSSVLCHKN